MRERKKVEMKRGRKEGKDDEGRGQGNEGKETVKDGNKKDEKKMKRKTGW